MVRCRARRLAPSAYRVYGLSAQAESEDLVVNDVVANTPITVTYCNIARCTRVVSSLRTGRPREVRQVGLDRGRLGFVTEIEDTLYFQDTQQPYNPNADSTPLPLSPYPAELMSWKAWKTLHPVTYVYAVPVPESSRQSL